MLGLLPLKAYVDKTKLGFMRRLLALPGHAVSKQVFLQRMFQSRLCNAMGSSKITGFANEANNILIKYDLDTFFDLYTEYGEFCNKQVWKNICKKSVANIEQVSYNRRTENDNNFKEFRHIQPDITKPNKIWAIASKYPYMTERCYVVAKAICRDTPEDEHLCEFCGRLDRDIIMHACSVCDKALSVRDNFWAHQ